MTEENDQEAVLDPLPVGPISQPGEPEPTDPVDGGSLARQVSGEPIPVRIINEKPKSEVHHIGDSRHWAALEAEKIFDVDIKYSDLVVPGEGFRAGVELTPFKLHWPDLEAMEDTELDGVVTLAMCYCSFHGECRYVDSRAPVVAREERLIDNCP